MAAFDPARHVEVEAPFPPKEYASLLPRTLNPL